MLSAAMRRPLYSVMLEQQKGTPSPASVVGVHKQKNQHQKYILRAVFAFDTEQQFHKLARAGLEPPSTRHDESPSVMGIVFMLHKKNTRRSTMQYNLLFLIHL